jgi:signal recognition particle receptor subunit beta
MCDVKEDKTDELRTGIFWPNPAFGNCFQQKNKTKQLTKIPCHILAMASSRLKIVVFGSFHAGKSTFIRAIDPASRHVDAGCGDGTTTVALDYGKVIVNDLQIHLYGTPGQERFGFARKVIMQGMDAALLMVDCTCAVDAFTKDLYLDLMDCHVPLGLMLNKCDITESCPAMARRELAGSRYLYEISAKDPVCARNALGRFVEAIVKV